LCECQVMREAEWLKIAETCLASGNPTFAPLRRARMPTVSGLEEECVMFKIVQRIILQDRFKHCRYRFQINSLTKVTTHVSL